jgi:RimJ/RimL family protein N-acetyltransferase
MRPDPLETARLIFRQPNASDLAPYTSYCLGDRSRFVGGPFNGIQAFEKLAAMIGHWELRGCGRFVFVDKDTRQAIGHVGALQLDLQEHPELTWTIWNGADEGKGYATEAVRAYREYAVGVLGLSHMIARIQQDNHRSRHLAERMGAILNERAEPPAWLPNSVTYDILLATGARCGVQQE